jgi:PAS domain S-box-containing protein
VRPDGSIRWVWDRGFPVRDAAGHLHRFAGITQDVTERKQAEEALRVSEERFAKAFRSSPHPIIVTEVETGRCIEANDASLQLFRFQRQEVIGQSTLTLGLWANAAERKKFVDRLLTEGSLRNLDMTFYTRDRTARRFLVSCELIELNGKHCMVTVGTDITEQKRAEEALRLSNRAVRQAFEERERLSQDLHDNLLQSLYAVGMGLELTKQKLRRISQTNVKRLDKSVAQLNAVIREVRNFIPGMQPPVVEVGTVADALRSLAKSFELTGAGPIKLSIDDQATWPLTSEHMTNLIAIAKEALSNSVRHTKATERTLTLHREKDVIRLTIMDNGCGFAVNRRRAQGLGLKNMRARARKLHARISISSSPRRGTVVSLTMPVR